MPPLSHDAAILKHLKQQIPNWPRTGRRRHRYNQHKQLYYLDLSRLGLAALPPELAALSHLQRLDLSHNQLTALPAEIGQLAQLQVLNLSHNQLRQLPAELGQLAQLEYLYLLDNQLTHLPAELGQLRLLTWLDLSGNLALAFPPPEVLAQGTKAILAYLREHQNDG